MTGRAFIRLISKRGIPLSCIANRLNCQLKTLRALEQSDKVPSHYVNGFKRAFKESLTLADIQLLST
ncbi:hypothetical protein PN836_002935 [Ningiella sp. W23]|uniref:hypothetical protein n=1 Tax=Ningiella sp. W23 TaxID=3023715 RepID=UPI003756EABF